MALTKKKPEGIATIDVSLVVIRVGSTSDGTEYAIDTANSIQVEVQTQATDPIQLVKDGRLLAQKLGSTTVTGNQITLTDNVFIPQVVQILQGGTISGTGVSLTYTPPLAGSGEKGQIFELDAYSAQYDASGQIVKYEKITYPNCQGTPVSINTEDGVFRLPEYVINSAPNTGQAPYTLSYVASLPDFSSATPNLMSLDEEDIATPVVQSYNLEELEPTALESKTTKVTKK